MDTDDMFLKLINQVSGSGHGIQRATLNVQKTPFGTNVEVRSDEGLTKQEIIAALKLWIRGQEYGGTRI